VSTGSVLISPAGIEDDDLQMTKVTFWRRLRRHRLAVAGFVVLAFIVLCAVFAPQLSPFDPTYIDRTGKAIRCRRVS